MGVKYHLKQHFIPHAGNNYHPHILHTKRAVFYGGFFLALKVFVIAFATILPAEAFLAPDVLAEQNRQIVAMTNSLRKDRGLPLLDVNSVLERSADMKAEDMNAKQYFSHTSPDGHGLSYFLGQVGYRYRFAGENLAVGFSDAGQVVDAWVNSPKHYANLIDTDFTQFGIGLVAGEYEGKPTVFVAQHFGTPTSEAKQTAPADTGTIKQTAPKPTAVAEKPAATTGQIAGIVAQAPVKKSDAKIAVQPTSKPTSPAVPVAHPSSVAVSTNSNPVQTIATSTDASTSTVSIATASNGSDSLNNPSGIAVPDGNVTEQGMPLNAIDASQSFVEWMASSAKQTTLVAQVHIDGDVDIAKVQIAGYEIPLTKEGEFYRGRLTASVSSKQLFKTIIPPTIDVRFKDGSSLQETIPWKNPIIVSQTPWEKYVQANSWLYKFIPVFPVVHGIYWFALMFFAFALALSVLIEIRRQHPHIIAQTVGLLGLIALMIWK